MLRNIYVQRDKKIFQDIKHFADIITDQIGFRLVTFTHFAGIITDQIGFRLVTGWLKCTDCTDFNPGNTPVFFIFTHFSKFFMKIKKKILVKMKLV